MKGQKKCLCKFFGMRKTFAVIGSRQDDPKYNKSLCQNPDKQAKEFGGGLKWGREVLSNFYL